MVVDWEQETGLLMTSGDVRIIRIWDTDREMKVQVTPVSLSPAPSPSWSPSQSTWGCSGRSCQPLELLLPFFPPSLFPCFPSSLPQGCIPRSIKPQRYSGSCQGSPGSCSGWAAMCGEAEAVESRDRHWDAGTGIGVQGQELGCRGGHWDTEAGSGM